MNMKGKEAMVKKLAAMIPVLIDKHSLSDMEGGSCKSVISDYFHETDMSGIRNKDVNRVCNSTNTKEIKLDLNIGKDGNRCRLTWGKQNCPVTRDEDLLWN